MPQRPKKSSVNAEEVARFSGLAATWWDEAGPMRPLHLMRPVRLEFIAGEARRLLHKELSDLTILDVGCGAGLMSEALAETGATVTGIDASEELIEAAREHGKKFKNLSYRCEAVENIKEKFDLVLALEVVEHVEAPEEFVKNCAAARAKNGAVIFSTLNRTPQSFLVAIVGAEYVLRIIPRGTHEWKKFIKPSELASMAKDAGLITESICGLVFNPLTERFSLDEGNVTVDYFLSAR
jgi:2-polyprenyl-6-hydroxyphenyl methylase/3-demethylubiquinone-9 3-methyltransferase